MRTNKQCPAGRYCVEGLHAEPNAVDCLVGMYCPQGIEYMVLHLYIYLFIRNHTHIIMVYSI